MKAFSESWELTELRDTEASQPFQGPVLPRRQAQPHCPVF